MGLLRTAEQQLIDKGADLTQTGAGGRTPLFTAAYFGWRKVAETLIAAQVDVNAKGGDDWCFLHAICLAFFSLHSMSPPVSTR